MSVLTAELSGSMRWLTTGPASRPRGIWWGALRGVHKRSTLLAAAARRAASASAWAAFKIHPFCHIPNLHPGGPGLRPGEYLYSRCMVGSTRVLPDDRGRAGEAPCSVTGDATVARWRQEGGSSME